MRSQSSWWHEQVLSPEKLFYKDFILLSEFSEIEGPLPLVIVNQEVCVDLKQADAKEQLKKLGLDSFDFNAFVLRVVSVDRTSSTNSESPVFSIPDDSQVYFTDNDQQFSAFTHHLTLFDIHARGYVHPVSLSYITKDLDKMMLQFDDLIQEFNQVSSHLKRGNYYNFMLDLKCRLLDLEYTRITTTHLSIESIEQASTLTRCILETLESTLPAIETPKDYQPVCIDALYPVPHIERKLRSLAQLCQPAQVIPLVYSMMEPTPKVRRLTFSNSVMQDMYQQVIQHLKQMAVYLSQQDGIEESDITEIDLIEQEKIKEASPVKDIQILSVLERYRSFIADVLFSLMTGRAVVVQGKLQNKSLIQQVVKALSVFVPRPGQIIEWVEQEKTDLETIKLMGIDKERTDSSIHGCILDIEQNTLCSGPVYIEGQWIHQMLDRMTLFTTDASYLAYLDTVFMTITLKAFIYHHLSVSNDFKMDGHTQRGYTSDTTSETESTSSTGTLSRKWSQKLLKYLKNQSDDDDENQATITPKRVEEQPRSLASLFEFPESAMRKNSVSSVDSLRSINSLEDVLNRAFIDQEFEDSDESLGPDGVLLVESRGRKYLEEKLKVYGDDQTIVAYWAACL